MNSTGTSAPAEPQAGPQAVAAPAIVVRARRFAANPSATIPSPVPQPTIQTPVAPDRPPHGDAARTYSVIEAIRDGRPHTPAVHESLSAETPIVAVDKFSLWYGRTHALHGIDMMISRGKVTALIGPSGCGKSTLLRSINRLNDLIEGVRVEGQISLTGSPIYAPGVDVIDLRKRMGMVFQKANPFTMSIFDNVVYALRIRGERSRSVLEAACERALRSAALWGEVKDRLKHSAMGLSGGQQQRLCIARAIVADPDVLLLDEPCSALDPIATMRIEELIDEIAARYTVVIVTHNMQQAARVSDFTAFMYLGRLVEYGATADIFQRPRLPETEQYVTGRYG